MSLLVSPKWSSRNYHNRDCPACVSYYGNFVLNRKKVKYLLIRQNISDGFITETNQEAAQLLFTEYFFGIPLEMSPTKLKLSENTPKRLRHQHQMSKDTHFLVIKPRNHLGKKPSWTISGSWVSINHFVVSSRSLPSLPSAWDSISPSFCSIFFWPCESKSQWKQLAVISQTKWQRGGFKSLICLFSMRRQLEAKSTSVLSLL